MVTEALLNGVKRNCCPKCGGSIMVDHIHHEVWQHQIRKTDGRVTMKKKKIKGKLIEPCYAYCENGCMEWFENEFEIDEFGHFFDLKYKSMYDNTLPSNNKKSRE